MAAEKNQSREDAMGEGTHSPTAMEAPAGGEPLIQPLPWTAEQSRHGELWIVRDVNGFSVMSEVTQDEAEFIVRCVNHHDELVAALTGLLEFIEDMKDFDELDQDSFWFSTLGSEVAAATAVLAKVSAK